MEEKRSALIEQKMSSSDMENEKGRKKEREKERE